MWKILDFLKATFIDFLPKRHTFSVQNIYELTNFIVDTFSKPLVFLRESVIQVTTSLWRRNAKAFIIKHFKSSYCNILLETCITQQCTFLLYIWWLCCFLDNIQLLWYYLKSSTPECFRHSGLGVWQIGIRALFIVN